jgi:arylsulfatase A-like enzyme
VRGHRTMNHMLQPDEPVLLKRLKDAGYYVFWAGKNDLVPAQHSLEPYCSELSKPKVEQPSSHGLIHQAAEPFSFYLGCLKHDPSEGIYRDGDWAHIEAALERIRTYSDSESGKAGQPLCLYLPIGYPHPPYGVEEPYYSSIQRNAIPTCYPVGEGKPSILDGIRKRQNLGHWTEDKWRELRATYLGMCARVDHQFSLILEALREAGLYDDTAAFFFSDHGDYTGDYGLVEKTQNTFEDCLTRVPLLFKPPTSRACRPGVRDVLVELIDINATVEELAELEPTHTHFGRSLLPLAADERREHRDAVFCEGGRLPDERHTREGVPLKKGEQVTPYWPRLSLQLGDGPEHGKAVMCRSRHFKYVRRLTEQDEFYDLSRDPAELRNVIDDPAYAHEVRRHKERLLTWFMETGDVVPFKPDRRW